MIDVYRLSYYYTFFLPLDEVCESFRIHYSFREVNINPGGKNERRI